MLNTCLAVIQFTGACKLDADHVVMIGGPIDQFYIHEISTDTCEKKTGKLVFGIFIDFPPN